MPSLPRALIWLTVLSAPLLAEVYTDPNTAGPDYGVQGEYRTADGAPASMACQVMALGDHRFRAYLLNGGLPGDGWDGAPPSVLEGLLNGGQVRFAGETDHQLLWAEGVLSEQDGQRRELALPKVTRVSPTLGAAAPDGALVLFDGTGLDAWASGSMDEEHRLTALSGPVTKEAWQDFELHVEFMVPFNPNARGQARANSGVYLQRRYEMQICDSFGNFEAHQQSGSVCGELYRSAPALVNAALPPLVWQTFDITFHAPLWDGAGHRAAPARLTARLNGILIHDDLEVPGKTGSGQPEGPQALPLYLQNHGAAVVFQNIWIKPLPRPEPQQLGGQAQG